MTTWARKSMYHLVANERWSICRVNIDGVASYELWETRGWNDHHCHARRPTADECKQRYEEIANGSVV